MKKGGSWERSLHVASGLKTRSPYLPWLERPTLVRELDSWNDGRQPEAIGVARREIVAGFRQYTSVTNSANRGRSDQPANSTSAFEAGEV
jgi:hypothetical protein